MPFPSLLLFILISTTTSSVHSSVVVPIGPLPNAEVYLNASNRSVGARLAAFGPRLPILPTLNTTFPPPPPLPNIVAGRLVPLIHADPQNHHGCLPVPPSVISQWQPSVGPTPLTGMPSLYQAKQFQEQDPRSLFQPVPDTIPRLQHQIPTAPWIALVQRGGCSFADKVINMQLSGAVGVIVGDDDSNIGNGLLTMFAGAGHTPPIKIPSVFISYNEYVRIVSDIRSFNTDVYLLGNGMVGAQDQWSVMDMILAAVVAPLILLIGVYALCRGLIRSTNSLSPTPDLQVHATSAKILNALPKKVFYRSKAREVDALSCVVCLDEFVDEEELLELPCFHHFHTECITVWLRDRKNVCPICRFELLEEEEEASDDIIGDHTAPLDIPETDDGPSSPIARYTLIDMDGSGSRPIGGAVSAPSTIPSNLSCAPLGGAAHDNHHHHLRMHASPGYHSSSSSSSSQIPAAPPILVIPNTVRRSVSTCSSPVHTLEFRIEPSLLPSGPSTPSSSYTSVSLMDDDQDRTPLLNDHTHRF